VFVDIEQQNLDVAVVNLRLSFMWMNLNDGFTALYQEN